MHLHGYALQTLEIGFERDYKAGNPVYRNLSRDAPVKDTMMVPSGGYVVGRVRTDNPGYWLLHCHIENHMRTGMVLMVKVGQRQEMVPPPANFPTCSDFPLLY